MFTVLQIRRFAIDRFHYFEHYRLFEGFGRFRFQCSALTVSNFSIFPDVRFDLCYFDYGLVLKFTIQIDIAFLFPFGRFDPNFLLRNDKVCIEKSVFRFVKQLTSQTP